MHILNFSSIFLIFLGSNSIPPKRIRVLSALVFRPGSYYTNTRLHSFLSVLTPESESGGIGGSTVFDFMSY